MRHNTLRHEFVEFMPPDLEEGVLYVSIPFDIAAHQCCCGCGSKVITPLSPTDWKLSYNGKSVSLYPSIGNWSFPCQSHYWIKRGKINWAGQWSQEEIAAGRRRDKLAKQRQFAAAPAELPAPVALATPLPAPTAPAVISKTSQGFWINMWHKLRGWGK